MGRTVIIASAALAAAAVLGLAGPPLVSQARTQVALRNLPDQTAPAVRTEQERIARLMENEFWATGPKACAARLLRTEGEHSWALVSCSGWYAGDPTIPGTQTALGDAPVHVVGNTIRRMGDGAEHARGIEREFPADLAPLATNPQPGVGPAMPTPAPTPASARR